MQRSRCLEREAAQLREFQSLIPQDAMEMSSPTSKIKLPLPELL
jgi:hypothetical protein